MAALRKRPLLTICVLACVLALGCTLQFDRSRLSRSCVDQPLCAEAENCCALAEILAGVFDRGYDRSDTGAQPGAEDVVGWQPEHAAPARIQALQMERFEVTAGRFRTFIVDYDDWRARGQPRPGLGAHPVLGEASGWQASFSEHLPTTAALVRARVDCEGATLDLDPQLPINCVDWYLAFAFCAWEGGRLPTEAEWNFVAAGGAEQRAFPWSSPGADRTITLEYAVASAGGVQAVGSRVALDGGRFGVHDLAGNLREWVLDYSPGDLSRYDPSDCSDCANLAPALERVRRGGDWAADAARARSAYRSGQPPGVVSEFMGIRCVHDL